jgi:hypothetical protein
MPLSFVVRRLQYATRVHACVGAWVRQCVDERPTEPVPVCQCVNLSEFECGRLGPCGCMCLQNISVYRKQDVTLFWWYAPPPPPSCPLF